MTTNLSKTKMSVIGKNEAAVMRSLVRKGVQAEPLECATRNPVVNALLQAMNDVVGSHTARLERRLSLEFHILRRIATTTIVLAHAAMRILEPYVAVEPPPAAAEVTARKKAFFNTLYRRPVGEAERLMEGMLDERDNALLLLVEKELITALRDEDLEATLQDLIPQPDGGPQPEE
jgi:hypothetical protein